MPFCTNCGGSVAGAFCNHCGTAVRAGAQPAGPTPSTSAGGAAAPVRRTSPIVWVLVVVLGLFVLGGLSVVGAGLFFFSKARQAGVDPDLMRTNPGLAVGKMMAAFNPDVEVVRTNDAQGTITLRDRHSGKEITITFDQARSGKFTFRAEDDRGKTAMLEVGGASSRLPSWIPEYPGAVIETNIAARGESDDGAGEGGNYSFTTKDSAAQVISFYQDKGREMGWKVRLNASGGEGGTLITGDEEGRRSLTVLASRGSGGGATVNVTYTSKH
jgi:hypothetical protein